MRGFEKFLSLIPASMEVPSHKHDFTFNDDGFEVCRICGLCTSLREMKYETILHENPHSNDNYSHILHNNHIGYVDDIEEEYRRLKSVIKRGYPNKLLYAYCTYIVLMRNSIFYTLTQISQIFQISNFQKCVCMIEKKYENDKSNFINDNILHIRSSIEIFLSQNMKIKLRKNAFQIAETLFKKNPYEKPVFLIALVLFLTLSSKMRYKRDLISLLCNYYSINKRTLCKKIKNIGQIKV